MIHLAAGVSGFVAAWVIGPRLQRDREVDAPNNLAMVAVGAGLLWMGWNGFNGGDWYEVSGIASAAVLNTNLCTAVAFLVWVALDYLTGRKPSLIGSVNGMIVGLVAITPGAGFVNGWGAIVIGVIASVIVYFALNYLSRVRPFRNVDDTLGVVYTHGFAGLAGGLLVGIFANNKMAETVLAGTISGGGLHLLKWQALTALWVIVFSAIGTFILLKLVGLVDSAADVRRGNGNGRHRRPRARGLPLRRAVARLPRRGARARSLRRGRRRLGEPVEYPGPCRNRPRPLSRGRFRARVRAVAGPRRVPPRWHHRARASNKPQIRRHREWPSSSSFPTTTPTTTATRWRSAACSRCSGAELSLAYVRPLLRAARWRRSRRRSCWPEARPRSAPRRCRATSSSTRAPASA